MRYLGPVALLVLSLIPRAEAQTPAFEPPPNLYTTSLHSFSVLRSGITINDPVTGVHHPASHTKDAVVAGTAERRDLTGGWYNAADYGKWTMMAAISVSYMLDLYEVQKRTAHSPHPSDPTLLDEAQ